MFKEIIPIVLILLLHNNTNSGKKYLVETEGHDEKGGPPLPDHLAEKGLDYGEVLPFPFPTKDNKEKNSKDKKGINTKEKKGVNTKDEKEVNSKDKKQGKDGEDYFFPFVNFNWGNRYARPSYGRPNYGRPNYGRGGCPKF